MSTGPEHYRLAEQQAENAARWAARGMGTDNVSAIVEAVNGLTSATLALAAATALMPVVGNEGQTADQWRPLIVPPLLPRRYDNPTEGE